ARRALHGRDAVERLTERGAELVQIDARLREQPAHAAAVLIEHRRHQVHGLDELMIAPHREGLRVLQRELKLIGELVHPHCGDSERRYGPNMGPSASISTAAAARGAPSGPLRRSGCPAAIFAFSFVGWSVAPRRSRLDSRSYLGGFPGLSSQIRLAKRPHGASRRCEKKRSAAENVQRPPPWIARTPAAARLRRASP